MSNKPNSIPDLRYFLLLTVVQSILFISCSESISSPLNSPTVVTNKSVYQNEKVILYLTNNSDRNIYTQKCEDRLMYFVERLDSGYSGFTAVFICRQPYNISLEPLDVLKDTVELFPGKYRTKHFYDFEDTQLLNNEIYSNTFIVY